jgi:hypothetical protein
MSTKKSDTLGLQRDLDQMAEEGIRADASKLKRDMCTQFTDPREWIREYCTNAHDAGARRIRVSGREAETLLTIVVEDDGHGMDEQGVLGFFTVYRSTKRGEDPIGHHGIGKLSVAAIPGQTGFFMRTSTSAECWQVRMGSLLADEPIRIEGIRPAPPAGTRFEITFTRKCSLAEELAQLRQVLVRYVAYLASDIAVDEVVEGEVHPGIPVNRDWRTTAGRRGRVYTATLGGRPADITVGFAPGGHEIYQSRVFITSRYNLTAKDRPEPLALPGLLIRVDSHAFELPFGRHCLRNEDILAPLAAHIVREVLPDYVGGLVDDYRHGVLVDTTLTEAEALFVSLLERGTALDSALANLPLFFSVLGDRHSLDELDRWFERLGVLYSEAAAGVGLDYAALKVPVLSRVQAPGAAELLQRRFGKRLVTLGVDDLVLEPPLGSTLGPRELRLAEHLRFHPHALGRAARQTRAERREMARSMGRPHTGGMSIKVGEEANKARTDLATIEWRVNYLVGNDGRSPCRTHRFLLRDKMVVLNLNHPDVARLLTLSDTWPALAGHWGLALALTDPSRRLLSHLSREAREELLVADAVAKCTGETEGEGEVALSGQNRFDN